MPFYVLAHDAIPDTKGRTRPAPGHADVAREWWAGSWIAHATIPGLADPGWVDSVPGLADQPVGVTVVATIPPLVPPFHPNANQGRHEIHELVDLSGVLPDDASPAGPFHAIITVGDLLGEWNAETSRTFASHRLAWLREHGYARRIANTPVKAHHGWPDSCMVQGGADGIVVRQEGGTYRTAFVEAFPADLGTFIRGEGDSVLAAENAAWESYQAILACPTEHATFETRGYRNGLGFCTGCGMSRADAFDVKDVGHPCTVCEVGTNWAKQDQEWYCQEHHQPVP